MEINPWLYHKKMGFNEVDSSSSCQQQRYLHMAGGDWSLGYSHQYIQDN